MSRSFEDNRSRREKSCFHHHHHAGTTFLRPSGDFSSMQTRKFDGIERLSWSENCLDLLFPVLHLHQSSIRNPCWSHRNAHRTLSFTMNAVPAAATLPKAAAIPARLFRTSLQCSANQGSNSIRHSNRSRSYYFSTFSSNDGRRLRDGLNNKKCKSVVSRVSSYRTVQCIFGSRMSMLETDFAHY